MAKAERVKRLLPEPFTKKVRGKKNLLWPWIAVRFPKNWQAVSYSVTLKGLLPGLSQIKKDILNSRTAALYFWMRWQTFPMTFRPPCCGLSRKENLNALADSKKWMLM